jgi:hypothetical protein
MTEFSGPPATKKMYALSAIIEERTAKGHGNRTWLGLSASNFLCRLLMLDCLPSVVEAKGGLSITVTSTCEATGA